MRFDHPNQFDEMDELDEKDAEPLGDKPRGSGEEVFRFFNQGREDRQPAFGVPPSLTTDPVPYRDRTENPQIVQYFQESPNSDQNRLIEGVWYRASMASSTACTEETCDGTLLTALEPGQRLDQPAVLLCGSGGRLLRIKSNRSDPECAAALALTHLTHHQLAT